MNFPFHPELMFADLNNFIDKIQELSELIGIPIAQLEMDHIAMRINQLSDAELAHQYWSEKGKVISQAIINGRPIIVLKLDSPLQVGHWAVPCVELPYPLANKPYPYQGWEHVECVIESDATSAEDYLADIQNQYPEMKARWSELATLGVNVKLSSPQGEGERLLNPTIAFKWKGICLKVHPYPLETVIQSESV